MFNHVDHVGYFYLLFVPCIRGYTLCNTDYLPVCFVESSIAVNVVATKDCIWQNERNVEMYNNYGLQEW
jgi:hypothetical protein